MAKHDKITINDFGSQWTRFRNNTGFYASTEVLRNLLSPLMPPQSLKGKKVADVGAGTGRYTRMLHALGAQEIVALEPSQAFHVLQENVSDLKNVQCLKLTAQEIPALDFDFIFCAGVLQFIPDHITALMAIRQALNKDGKAFFWVYGRENNTAYLSLIKPLRFITTRLPSQALDRLASLLVLPASAYAVLSAFLNIPLADYMNNYFSKMNFLSRKMIIYDQLNPVFSRYFTRTELFQALEQAGFSDIHMHHHLNYSWSALCKT